VQYSAFLSLNRVDCAKQVVRKQDRKWTTYGSLVNRKPEVEEPVIYCLKYRKGWQ
jgi:hypothetical protein